jgi:thymidylate kinase
MSNWIAEEWFRQLVVWAYQRRGYVVLLDRHFIADYYAYDIVGRNRGLSRRLHGFLLWRLYPRPDLVLCLDAPGSLLWKRKGEGQADLLERRRHEYLRLEQVFPNFHVVDASRSAPEVARHVANLIRDFAETRWRTRSR